MYAGASCFAKGRNVAWEKQGVMKNIYFCRIPAGLQEIFIAAGRLLFISIFAVYAFLLQ